MTPGDYTVVETQPAGLFNVSEDEGGIDDDQPDDNTINSIAATVNPGENDAGNDFVEVEPGSLSGNVSQDTTGDGAGDTPIPEVTLSLLDGAGNPVTDGNGDPVTTTTDTAGNYQFTNLTPGDYTVVETQPAGLFNVSEDEGGIDDDQPDNNTINSIAATVNPGENDAGNDFVEVEPGSLSGNVSQDTTGDGAGDTPIPEVTLSLLDGAGNPVTDGNGDPVTTTTDTAGNYQFTNLTPGDYTVVETQPAGLFNVSEDEGGIDDDQPDDGELNSIAATVNPGENDAGNDFVEVEPGSLSGNVSQDTTGDGNGDTPIENVELSLLDAAGDPVTDGNGDAVTTTTDTDGNYSFNNLTPGDYTVVETQPDGLFNVSEDEGGIDDDQPDNNTINSIAATVNPGENDANNDFVEETPIELFKLSGTVFEDTNAPDADTIEGSDSPISGVTVELFNADDLDNAIASTTTDDAGFYEFTDLANGEYVVKETQPGGFESVTDIDGTDDNQIAVTITDGNSTGNDFLEEVPPVLYALSGTVFDDTNEPDADGIEPTDTPIAGVTVELFNADDLDNAIASTTTDDAGFYEFTDLANGEYVVKETQPGGFESVTDIDGTDDNQIAVTITDGNSTGNDFLEEVPPVLYALSGTVFDDTNAPDADGIDTTDTPIAGVTVELFNADDLDNAIASTTTDDAGFYEFTDLANGEYVVKETQPWWF